MFGFSSSSKAPKLDPCIIVMPVPSRDTQSRCLSRTLCALRFTSDRLEIDISAVLQSCQLKWKPWCSCSHEIYVPFSLEQRRDQHYVILQASRYLINRWDVEGYFQEGCADEARFVAVGLGLEKKERKKGVLIIWLLSAVIRVCLCDNTNYSFLMHAALDRWVGFHSYCVPFIWLQC